jgi:dephospho-CoA kinase
METFKTYGVTGGAGTGKSEVMRLLREDFGGFTILSDDVARDLMHHGGTSYQLIVDHFGQEVVGEDGELDRNKLAQIVFQDKEELEQLNSMTHPYVRKEIIRLLKEAEESGLYPFAALESAILLECGYEDICDEFWYVYSSPEIRRARMKETRGYSDEKVDAVMKSQMQDEQAMQMCDFVIVNNSTLEEVKRQLSEHFGA